MPKRLDAATIAQMRNTRPPIGGSTPRAGSSPYHRAERHLAAIPAESILHPAAIGAVVLLVVNDHVLKSAWPGFLTGKLSDAAGLTVVPLVLLGCWEVSLWLTGRWRRPARRGLLVAATATAIGFFLVKTTDAGAWAFGWTLSFGQWLPALLAGLLSGHGSQMGEPAPIAHDATDLIAMPLVLLAIWIGSRRTGGAASPSQDSRRQTGRGLVRRKGRSDDSKDLAGDHPADRRLRTTPADADPDDGESELQGFRSLGRPDQVRLDSEGPRPSR
jgi:hypothetical protein